jgi:hypothetical protein
VGSPKAFEIGMCVVCKKDKCFKHGVDKKIKNKNIDFDDFEI